MSVLEGKYSVPKTTFFLARGETNSVINIFLKRGNISKAPDHISSGEA